MKLTKHLKESLEITIEKKLNKYYTLSEKDINVELENYLKNYKQTSSREQILHTRQTVRAFYTQEESLRVAIL